MNATVLEHSKNNGAIFLDADGCYKIRVKAHDALIALKPYSIGFNGTDWVTAALANTAKYQFVGVPLGSVASGAYANLVIGGEVDNVVVPNATHAAGRGIKIHAGAVTQESASYIANATYLHDWAVSMETHATASTALKMFLVQHITGMRLATV